MSPKNLLYFLLGAALGAGVSFYFTREKYIKENREALDEVKEYYKKFEKESKKDGIEENNTVTIKATDVGAEEFANYEVETKPYRDILDNDLEDEEIEDADEEILVLHPEETSDRPYVIDESSFVNERTYYDKLGLNFYSLDNVVTDEMDEIVLDWEKLVGPNLGTRFKKQSRFDENFDYIYIRNDSVGADYEVHIIRENYY